MENADRPAVSPRQRSGDYVARARELVERAIRRFELSASEADLLGVLLACEVEPAVARLIAYLGGNQSQFAITLDLMGFPGKEFFASPVGRACPGGL